MKLKLAITTAVMLGLSPSAQSQYQCIACPNGTWSSGGTRTSCRSLNSASSWSLRGYYNGQSGSITKDRTYMVYLRGGNGGSAYYSRYIEYGGSGAVLQYRFTAPFSGQYYLAAGSNSANSYTGERTGGGSIGGAGNGEKISINIFDDTSNFSYMRNQVFGVVGGVQGGAGFGKASHSKNYSSGLTCYYQVCLWEFTG